MLVDGESKTLSEYFPPEDRFCCKKRSRNVDWIETNSFTFRRENDDDVDVATTNNTSRQLTQDILSIPFALSLSFSLSPSLSLALSLNAEGAGVILSFGGPTFFIFPPSKNRLLLLFSALSFFFIKSRRNILHLAAVIYLFRDISLFFFYFNLPLSRPGACLVKL